MNRKKQKQKMKKLRFFLRMHAIFTAIVFGVYFLAAFFYNPHFFFSDIREKLRAVADTVTITATVLDSPVDPIVIATPVCVTGSAIDLDWPDDVNTYTYDIIRDSSALVTGLTQSSYHDTFVVPGNEYEYVVIANGPMDPFTATSAPVAATAIESCVPPPPPTPEPTPNPEPTPTPVDAPVVSILTIGSKSVYDTKAILSLTDATPRFTGNSNIANAIIHWTVQGEAIISGETVANKNGYWSWQLPMTLSDRRYVVFVTALDPTDTSRTAMDMESFQIAETPKDEKKKSEISKKNIAPNIPQGSEKDTSEPEAIQLQESPLDFSLSIENPLNVVTQGDDVIARVSIDSFDSNRYGSIPTSMQYSVLNEEGKVVAEETGNEKLSSGKSLRKNIFFSKMPDQGEYVLRTSIAFDRFIVTREHKFFVRELPLIHFGAGFVITYPQFVRNLGWIVGISLILLFLIVLLWIREYWLYLHALRHITERHLEGKGFVKKREGVVR